MYWHDQIHCKTIVVSYLSLKKIEIHFDQNFISLKHVKYINIWIPFILFFFFKLFALQKELKSSNSIQIHPVFILIGYYNAKIHL